MNCTRSAGSVTDRGDVLSDCKVPKENELSVLMGNALALGPG